MKRYLAALFLFSLSLCSFAQTDKSKNEASQCTAFPCVVASVSLTNQATAAFQVPIYTPTTDGLFRISAYVNTSAGSVNRAYWEILFGWTDDVGTQIGGQSYLHQKSYDTVNIVAHDLAGQPLAYSVKRGSGGVGTMTYNLFIVVEQLQ